MDTWIFSHHKQETATDDDAQKNGLWIWWVSFAMSLFFCFYGSFWLGMCLSVSMDCASSLITLTMGLKCDLVSGSITSSSSPPLHCLFMLTHERLGCAFTLYSGPFLKNSMIYWHTVWSLLSPFHASASLFSPLDRVMQKWSLLLSFNFSFEVIKELCVGAMNRWAILFYDSIDREDWTINQ